jgi:type IV pilus assembly protein PilX
MVNIDKQQGIVLIAAMLIILMVSGIAISLMTGSAIDSKIVNATQDSYRAESIGRGDTEQAIKAEIGRKEASKFIIKRSAYESDSFTIEHSGDSTVTVTNVNTNPNMDLLDCPARFAPTPGIKCNYLKLETTRNYGSNNKNKLIIKTGIEQEMIGNQ